MSESPHAVSHPVAHSPLWCKTCESYIPSSALAHVTGNEVHSVSAQRPDAPSWGRNTRRYSYRWFDPRQDTFTQPAIEITTYYDQDTHTPDQIGWQLGKALEQMLIAIREEQA
jgi:hypothetical protein